MGVGLALALALLAGAPEKPPSVPALRTACYGGREKKPLAPIARDEFRRRASEAVQKRELPEAKRLLRRLLRGHDDGRSTVLLYLSVLGEEDEPARTACARLAERLER